MRIKGAFFGSLVALLFAFTTVAAAGVVSYQGRVELGGSPYSGPGYFKFAVVDAAGTTTAWSNDGTSASGSQPTAAVTLVVTNGLFDVLLGDATLANMTDLPGSAFPSGTVRMLRVWFSTSNAPGSFTQLAPDRRVASVPNALQADQAANAHAVIPFSSGIITPSSATFSAPIVMGFGAFRQISGSSMVEFGQFAFTAPSNGILERLQVSADVHFTPNTAQSPFSYIFEIERSPSGVPTYSSVPLTVTVSFPAVTTTTYPTGAYVTSSSFALGAIPVAAGDRIVLVATSTMPFAPPAVDQLGLQGGLLFTPLP